MSWNHRVLLHELDNELNIIHNILQVHEVYYADGKPNGYTSNPITINGENPDELEWTLNKIKDCLKKPILWAGKRFPEEVKVTYECQLCGRDKFNKQSPHKCVDGFRKYGLEWKIIYK